MIRRKRIWTRLAAGAVAMVVVAACSEQLNSPGDCPALCPGGDIVIFDTILFPVTGADSTFTGYAFKGQSGALPLSQPGFAAGNARVQIRLRRRPDSVLVRDTLRTYTIDSVQLGLGILTRDTLLTGLSLSVWRVPQTIDSLSSVAEIDAALTPDRLLGTMEIPDTLKSGSLLLKFQGPDLAKIDLTADTGVLNLALTLNSATTTGVRVAGLFGGSLLPVMTTYANVDIADTTLRKRVITTSPFYTTYQIDPPDPTPGPQTLVVGGGPSARAMIRFQLPDIIRDSAQLVRATLELVPVVVPQGIPNESATIEAQGVLTDLGAKSPLIPSAVGQTVIKPGQSDTVKVEIVRLVQLWQGDEPFPSTLFVLLTPEGGSFLRPVFGSSQSAMRPRLRISYTLPFPFEAP